MIFCNIIGPTFSSVSEQLWAALAGAGTFGSGMLILTPGFRLVVTIEDIGGQFRGIAVVEPIDVLTGGNAP